MGKVHHIILSEIRLLAFFFFLGHRVPFNNLMKANETFSHNITQTSTFCMQFWEFTDCRNPSINSVSRPLLVGEFSVLLIPYPRLELLISIYPIADEKQVLPVCVFGLSGVSTLYFWCKQLAFQKWELLLIVSVWLRQSETVFSKCSMGNMSEGRKPNTNGLHESIKGYVGISSKRRGRRGCTSVWDALEPACDNVKKWWHISVFKL